MGKERKPALVHLLSDNVCVVRGLSLEGAVVGPEIDRGRNTGNTSFVDLFTLATRSSVRCMNGAHHVCSFTPGDREFQIGIFLPVSEQQRELGEKPIIGMAHCGDCLRVGVPVDTTFECLCASNEPFPGLEIIRIIELESPVSFGRRHSSRRAIPDQSQASSALYSPPRSLQSCSPPFWP